MAYTYSTPQTRAQARRTVPHPAGGLLEPLLLGVAALLVVSAMALVYSAKTGAMRDVAAGRARGEVLNVNTVSTAEALAPALRVFADARERQFVAREVLDQLSGGGTGPRSRRSLPNVGALARLTVDARRVETARGVMTLRARLDDERKRAAPNQVERLALFTPAQVAALKPGLIVRTASSFRRAFGWHVLLVVAGFALVHAVRRSRGAAGDPLILPVLFLLCGLGMSLMVSLRDPLRDTLLAVPFAQGVAAGCALLLAVTFVDVERSVLSRLSYVPLVLALALSALLVAFGTGPGGSDARVNLFGVQPVDAIKLLITFFLAGYFARRWEFLRELEEKPGAALPWWRDLRLPRRQDVVPVASGVAIALAGFFLQKDLGPALIVACVFLGMYAVARGRWGVALGGLALLGAGFVAGHALRISSTLAARVEMWRSPWENGVRGGEQVAQALWALASGGWTGTGLGLGMPEILPAAHTDLVLAGIGEELGFAGLTAVALLYAVLGARGLSAARRAAGEYSSLLALGLTLGLLVPVLLIAAGLLGLAPLSGVVTPFLSYGRSALTANFVAAGLLLSIADRSAGTSAAEPFDRPLRTVGLALATLALVCAAAAARAQTWAADDILVAGALTRQGDGQRRYSYNPRLLAAAHLIVRGTIFDRSGIPVATSDPDVLRTNASLLSQAGVQPNRACRWSTNDSAERRTPDRCYPFGGPMFFLLGDFESQVNWAAPNTSYVERDHDSRLRGYDDQARTVDIVDPSDGSRTRTVRRNLRALLPLWRHRGNPEHPEVKRLLEAPREVRLTVDARLQARVSTLVRDRLAAARLRQGAVVVIDVASGDLLAAASYPWPDDPTGPAPPGAPLADRARGDAPGTRSARLLDRARYGVYPPGSTFKLVTAAAVLRAAPALADQPLVCRRLEEGRVGNTVPGWRRPIRDDITDRTPHGEVTLEPGLVHSCNAYFAQLGARVGGGPLRDTATLFDIAVTRGGAPQRLRDTLPFAAYGQGEVLATPLRMARVAATIAGGGVLPPASAAVATARAAEPGTRVLDEASARRLADAMRQVVVSGTARGLMAHPELVAGKTGTAEVEGVPSHSWFVGFAPHGPGVRRRIAFAVIVENGGYGGRVAAPIAGEVVSLARELGLLDGSGR